ncbi:hypothetical protein SAMN05421578_103512 [Paenibacillus macquariensis]|uniref:Uncharacterized protein n=1 Tax=Paenibacillus macquariensis TaxID=948756 RepID=A0ABY1JT63_9BACL|nr:hypothetical protein SAMN05421578_103512 [Paenibacillus macquariensis]
MKEAGDVLPGLFVVIIGNLDNPLYPQSACDNNQQDEKD